MIDERIRAIHLALERRRPRLLEPEADVNRAAVALILRAGPEDLEILLIQRSISDRDPWSGHMALPGGRRDGAEEPLDTAMREAREEVDVRLDREGMLLGRLDDVRPSTGGPQIAVSPFIFAVDEGVEISIRPAEVAAAVWVPLAHLAEPGSAAEHLHILPGGRHRRFPALAYGDYVIWGLTYRMLIQFLGICRAVRVRSAE